MLFYQLVGYVSYEGEDHLGFFSSEEKAKEALDTHSKKYLGNFQGYIIYRCSLDDGTFPVIHPLVVKPLDSRVGFRFFYVNSDDKLCEEEKG